VAEIIGLGFIAIGLLGQLQRICSAILPGKSLADLRLIYSFFHYDQFSVSNASKA
jgi:hypothetical protein